MENPGRPKADIPWNIVDDYLRAHCDGMAIAGILGISADTLYRRCQQDNNIGFEAYSRTKKAEGDELLRKKQMDTALDGNVAMQIWLGKQYLEQKERHDLTTKDDKITAKEIFKFEIVDPLKVSDVDKNKPETSTIS